MNLPKSVLSSPNQCETIEETQRSHDNLIIGRATFNEIVRVDARECQQEAHQSRIKNLRKELEYLKSTNWKYQPIEKYVGQS